MGWVSWTVFIEKEEKNKCQSIIKIEAKFRIIKTLQRSFLKPFSIQE